MFWTISLFPLQYFSENTNRMPSSAVNTASSIMSVHICWEKNPPKKTKHYMGVVAKKTIGMRFEVSWGKGHRAAGYPLNSIPV